ncbi:hypothetical protein ACO1O0_004048 [Amphichorda felina]
MITKTSWAAHGDPIHDIRSKRSHRFYVVTVVCLVLFCVFRIVPTFNRPCLTAKPDHHGPSPALYPYGRFPRLDDPFLLMPCTNATLLPQLDDAHPEKTWAALYDPNPDNWSWANATSDADHGTSKDPYAGRGIYLCGYLDVPLDYGNASEHRIVRLAINKIQVSGLKRIDRESTSSPAGEKSSRTIVLNPGGPGGSGTEYLWRAGEDVTRRFSNSTLDVLSFDPRGVNASLPAISAFPYNADRDHWSLFTGQYREATADPRAQLEVADAMAEAIFRGLWERDGDLPRFMTTALVARDLEQIRLALGEDELTAYLVSYGTGIGQTYANMFPDSVGRIILDGTEYVRDHRLLAGFGWTALDNATDAWHDGFLGECIDAGPEHCALAKPVGDRPVTLEALEERMGTLLSSLMHRPMAGYTDFGGPALVTYTAIVDAIYAAMYNAQSWPTLAQMLFDLEAGNTTLAAQFLEHNTWRYDPTLPPASRRRADSDELSLSVICGDSYDAPLPEDGLDWWESLWANMTSTSWIAGNSRFLGALPCQHYTAYWPRPAEVYRGSLGNALRHPVLLVAEVYDPATPLRNGRRLLGEMGRNARLVVHHGYGHSTRDRSACTDGIARRYILEGEVPDEAETACYADEKPYRYGVKAKGGG